MDKEKYYQELIRKYELATCNEYKEIRERILNFIVKCSNSAITPERIQGMLLLVGEIDSWIVNYERELAKRKDS